jgi:hypothetical protein
VEICWNVIDCKEDVVHYLKKGPREVSWPDAKKLRRELGRILSLLSEPLRSDFVRYCLSCHLLSDTADRRSEVVRDLLPVPDTCGIPFSFDELETMRWRCVAIPTVEGGGSGNVVYVLLGMTDTEAPFCPPWCASVLDANALEAVHAAFVAASRLRPGRTFFFWPALPTNVLQISGDSLGLPVFLGCDALIHDRRIPANVLATGVVRRDGTLGEVGGLEAKLSAARLHNFKAFVYPCLSGEDELSSVDGDGVEMLPAATLAYATRAWCWYVPGHGAEISKFLALVERPESLVSNLAAIPPVLLGESSVRGHITATLRSLALRDDRGAFGALRDFANAIDRLCNTPTRPMNIIMGLLDLVDGNMLDCIAVRHESTQASSSGAYLAWDFTLFQAETANHCGDIAGTTYWLDRATTYSKAVRHLEGVDAKRLYSLLVQIVGNAHNAYCFSPVLQGLEMSEDFEELLRCQEEDFLRRESRCTGVVSDTLGRYYGTMMQQFAFCGKEYLDQARDYSDKSLHAFSGGVDYANEQCLRQYGYLVYLYLDADEPDKAKAALLRYLGVSELSDIRPERLEDYEHAALARYLADTGNRRAGYLESAPERIDTVLAQHPNQLWLYNMGRIFTERDLKKKAWLRSVEICFALERSDTVPVMALLPLSSLYHLELCPKGDLGARAERSLAALENEHIYRPHFHDLTSCADWETALALVHDHPSRYFPFSYR